MIPRITILGGTRAALVLLAVASLRPSLVPIFETGVEKGDDKPWALKPPAPAVALKPPKLEKLEGETCGQCHADVVTEWASTAHAIAWVDEVYREEVKDKSRPDSCYGCHVPKPILPMLTTGQGGGPMARAEARSDGRDLGISCQACHEAADGTMVGPWGAATSAHKTASSPSMTEKAASALCAVCHSTNIGPVVGIAKDFVAAKLEESGKSCIACHMAPMERAPSKSAAEGASPQPGRSHALQTPRDPAFLALGFEPSLRIEGGKSVVTIRNRAGHRIPGLIGRKIEFKAEVLDAGGKTLAQGGLTLDARSYLPIEKSVELAVGAAGSAVRLRGLHFDPRRDEPVEFLNVRLEASGR
jgi:cytochrome c5